MSAPDGPDSAASVGCPHCGASPGVSSQFCPSCGGPLFCPVGHAVLDAGQRFCLTCGVPLAGERPAVEIQRRNWRAPVIAGVAALALAVAGGCLIFAGGDDEGSKQASPRGVTTPAGRAASPAPAGSAAAAASSPSTAAAAGAMTVAPTAAAGTATTTATALPQPTATPPAPPTSTPVPATVPPTPAPAPAIRSVPVANATVSSGLAPGVVYDTATVRVQIDPARTLWVAWNNTPGVSMQRPERPGAALLGPGGYGTDDHIEVTVRAPGGATATVVLDRNDAFGRSTGPQNVIFGTAAAAPDVFRISPPFATPPNEVFIFDEGGTHNGLFTGAGEYEFTFKFINAYTGDGGHAAIYLLVFATP